MSFDMLSDTGGADLNPYMENLMSNLRQRWLPMVNSTAKQPLLGPKETLISLTIAPDGNLVAMRLDSSTHSEALNKAAWTAAAGTPYAPTPPGMRDRDLKLRVHFVAE